MLAAFAVVIFGSRLSIAQTCVVMPTNGPFAGDNIVLVTNASPIIGNGVDITNVTVGGVAGAIAGQGVDWVTIITPAIGSAGAKDIVIQSTSVGATTFADAYMVNPAGQIGGVAEDWSQWMAVVGLPAHKPTCTGTTERTGPKWPAYRLNVTTWLRAC